MPKERGSVSRATTRIFAAGRDADSAARARHFVAERIAGRLDELRENAELVTSELVTNVLVHTNSAATVRVRVTDDSLRVEVQDDCSVLPVGGILDVSASCGRGLLLVERLTHRWGVTRVPGAGKSVWFELIAGVPTPADDLSVDDLLDMWDDDDDHSLPSFDVLAAGEIDGEDTSLDAGEATHPVRITGVPTALLNATRSHLDDLIRDLTLIIEAAAAGHPHDDDLLGLGCRLADHVVELAEFRYQIRRQGLAAAHRQDENLTLELELRPSLRSRLIDYRDALDEADEASEHGRLLLPPAPRDLVEFRRWKLNRIIEQLPREATTAE